MIHEAQTVGRSFSSARVLTGPAARRDALDRDGATCDVLHLACHGIFRTDDPLFSALRLADGWLMVHDIYRLRLSAQLVTLSGCQTGRQAIGPGDDLIGLARGFFSAGATQLVVSLWMVNDESTGRFMETFYGAWNVSGSAATALREAQMSLRREYPHPYYWAPFVVIGAS
jgi:CHAT domain-containing protein